MVGAAGIVGAVGIVGTAGVVGTGRPDIGSECWKPLAEYILSEPLELYPTLHFLMLLVCTNLDFLGTWCQQLLHRYFHLGLRMI